MVVKDTFGRWETERQLWLALRQGDEQAFTFIFEKYHRTLYNYGCKLTTHTAVTEDAIQDIFIDIWRLRANLTENISSIKFYLYRALRRRIHQTLDKYPATEEISDITDPEIMPFSFSDSQTMLIESESNLLRAQRIKELLAQLPERQLEAITLRYFDEFSIAEIGQIMGVNEKSVRNFLYKALTAFRQTQNVIINFLLIICSLSNF
ncbi:hypothetical protein DYBT9623_05132 [Dyadobacter sp. CECT 9623]|uniref:Sigma-70 family RNA polymerase sigma factor n=1 Tax=Dyadobacter linearis TaxID=2823330 RepID=A0ABN7RHP3_9BACT|nr:RNA polymerase sigma factor [Dyadobacter sp. CECT 9623]CAG5074445.1 hypothetical protein DYBT9623_05132 [Dyadobacter sp. CECT 9623]